MNNTIILEQPFFQGMFNTISFGTIMEAAHIYTRNKLMKKKEAWDGERTDMYKITNIGPIEKFMADYNLTVDVIVGDDSLDEKNITDAVNYFLNNIEKMEDIATTALYDYYIDHYREEYEKVYDCLVERIGKESTIEVLNTFDKEDFNELMLAYFDNILISDTGLMGMSLYTDWGISVVVYFYDIKKHKIIKNKNHPYYYRCDELD